MGFLSQLRRRTSSSSLGEGRNGQDVREGNTRDEARSGSVPEASVADQRGNSKRETSAAVTVVSFLRMVLFTRSDGALMRRAAKVLHQQNLRVAAAKEEALHAQMLALMAQRAARDIAISWRESVYTGEPPEREDLDQMVRSLSDSVAYLEEHSEFE